MCRRSRITNVLQCLLALLLLVVAGCGREGSVPTAVSLRAGDIATSTPDISPLGVTSPGGFYPLEIGNSWRYAGTFSKTFTPKQGEPTVKRGRWTREAVLAHFVVLGGRTYVQEEGVRRDESQEIHTVRFLRQDRSGLYEAGPGPLPLADSPRSVPPSVTSLLNNDSPLFETTLLTYPIHRGATWVISPVQRIVATVEGMEVLVTPAGRFPAWRVRVRNHGHDPREEAFAWYGHAGYLGMSVHLQYEKLDQNGEPIIITQDQAEWLEAIELRDGAPRRGDTGDPTESSSTDLGS